MSLTWEENTEAMIREARQKQREAEMQACLVPTTELEAVLEVYREVLAFLGRYKNFSLSLVNGGFIQTLGGFGSDYDIAFYVIALQEKGFSPEVKMERVCGNCVFCLKGMIDGERLCSIAPDNDCITHDEDDMWIVGRFVHPDDECYLPENGGYLSFIPVEARVDLSQDYPGWCRKPPEAREDNPAVLSNEMEIEICSDKTLKSFPDLRGELESAITLSGLATNGLKIRILCGVILQPYCDWMIWRFAKEFPRGQRLPRCMAHYQGNAARRSYLIEIDVALGRRKPQLQTVIEYLFHELGHHKSYLENGGIPEKDARFFSRIMMKRWHGGRGSRCV